MSMSKFFDDFLGLDPGGGGLHKAEHDMVNLDLKPLKWMGVSDDPADDIMGFDQNGAGAVKRANKWGPWIAAAFGGYAAAGAGAAGGAGAGAGEAGAAMGAGEAGGLAAGGAAGGGATYGSLGSGVYGVDSVGSLSTGIGESSPTILSNTASGTGGINGTAAGASGPVASGRMPNMPNSQGQQRQQQASSSADDEVDEYMDEFRRLSRESQADSDKRAEARMTQILESQAKTNGVMK